MLNRFLTRVLSFLIPHCCEFCARSIPEDNLMCLSCKQVSMNTDHSHTRMNEVMARVAPRLEPLRALALYQYQKEGQVRQLLHKLKYGGRKDIGMLLGKELGQTYLDGNFDKLPQLIIPIPVHRSRKRKRGYNQCWLIAQSASKVLGVPAYGHILVKKKKADTLTAMKRTERFEYVKSSFQIRNVSLLYRKRVLLIDDVLTTGATMEAASKLLLESGCASVEWGLIAIANI